MAYKEYEAHPSEIISYLKPIEGELGHFALPVVADAYNKLKNEVKSKYGYDLKIMGPNSSFRSPSQQNLMRQEYPGQAAPEGVFSAHEFGMAFDIKVIINKKEYYLESVPKIANQIWEIALNLGFKRSKRNDELHHFEWGDYNIPEKYILGEEKAKNKEYQKNQDTYAPIKLSSGGDREIIEKSIGRFNPSLKDKDKIIDTVINECNKAGISVSLAAALIENESSWNPNAQSTFTDAQGRVGHANGLMQMIPDTAAAMGVADVWDPVDNIKGGIKYLKQQYDKYGGNLDKLLSAYNAGPGAVDQYGGIPPFKETINYVKNIKNRMNELEGSTPKSMDINKLNTIMDEIGLIGDDKYLKKIKDADLIIHNLRGLLSDRFKISQTEKNNTEWNQFEQFAKVYYEFVTGLFSAGVSAYTVLRNKNLNDPAVMQSSNVQKAISKIEGLYNAIKSGHVKNVLTDVSEVISMQNISNVSDFVNKYKGK